MNRLFAILFSVLLVSPAIARGPAQRLATPTFDDMGNFVTPFSLFVGSMNVVKAYLPPTDDSIRRVHFDNPNTNFILMVSTWDNFTVTDSWFMVQKGSASIDLTGNATFYLRYAPGASSETVRGFYSRQ